ncbi:MAG TPA: formate dehydrogenase accessory sulfurtransferase FdhD [Pusillimonas sp.]|uniref:formate dehydrogenase accessory sulfurtransferase FdhD n=1 Tax=unclassified Pusillimonas TaxID=2640016 RepID=UPI0026224C15|nr:MULTISPECIES: formate dehydrogenase accessory sulfurtransferase FdhD [unclassified Pusillimonas]HLU18513.1 formate dehydrogenase accessory sulfurtransferase FdhD [Pusillimonas sp.]
MTTTPAHSKPEPAPADDQEGLALHTVHRQRPGSSYTSQQDQLAQEVPIALEYNGISHATVLATPCDLEDFAFGFSYTEGVIRSARDIYDVELTRRDKGIVIELTIASACLNQLKLRRRSLAGRTGCGLCGLESLDEVQRSLPPLNERPAFLNAEAVAAATSALRELQPLHLQTGATHAAGWANIQGRILAVREDVGRHNALDKLIGHLIRQDHDTSDGFAVISSRASFEMVQKAAAAGISAVVAVSAPTTYAVQMADELNVLLAGFARETGFTVYAHPEFLIPYVS